VRRENPEVLSEKPVLICFFQSQERPVAGEPSHDRDKNGFIRAAFENTAALPTHGRSDLARVAISTQKHLF
jgi:hypothetical protein